MIIYIILRSPTALKEREVPIIRAGINPRKGHK